MLTSRDTVQKRYIESRQHSQSQEAYRDDGSDRLSPLLEQPSFYSVSL